MQNFCAQVGCSYINMLSALRARAMVDNRDVYFPSDEHLGIQGHEVIAEAVVAWIDSQ
jgi:hypothetical protein